MSPYDGEEPPDNVVDLEIARLEREIDEGKKRDAHNRRVDAVRYLRLAMALLEGCIETPPRLARATQHLMKACDELMGDES